jgi:hypothetical protein
MNGTDTKTSAFRKTGHAGSVDILPKRYIITNVNYLR